MSHSDKRAYWFVVIILMSAILYWGFMDGITSHTPIAILGFGYVLAHMFGGLNREKKPILPSIRSLIFNTKYSWIGLMAITLVSIGIIWIYIVEKSISVRIIGLLVFFTTINYCLEIGKDARATRN